MKVSAVASVLLIFAVHLVSAQEIHIDADSELDWQRGTIGITMTATAAEGTSIRPDFIFRARQQIDRAFPSALFDSLLPLRVDSVRLVHEVIRDEPALASRISALAAQAEKGLPRPNANMTMVQRDYHVPIFPDFVQLFMEHEIPFRMEEVISWVPTAEFTGVIIYAADPLPLRGTDDTVYVEPALLPEIYDSDLRPVLEQDMLDPGAGSQWGAVAYSADTNEDPWRYRVGNRPIRIMAREAFGVHPTDIIIEKEDADMLLATEHNRSLLRSGRILVILHSSQITRAD